MTGRNRVLLTGAGVVSPIGSGMEEFMQNLSASVRGVDLISCFDTQYFPVLFGGEARRNGVVIQTDTSVDRKEIFIRSAMHELWQHSVVSRYDPSERLLCLGAGIDYFDLPGYAAEKDHRGWRSFSKKTKLIVDHLASDFSIGGGHLANVSACVASSQAMGLALRLVRQTPDKAVITGGFDSMLSHLHYMGFYNLGALSDWTGEPGGACRPFAQDRCGLVIGEGAVAYLLESEVNATPERVLCEIAGYASTMDAYMVTDPDPSGKSLAEAAFGAISDAGITPDDIDLVDLHGTGTVKNALAEVKAMETVFPGRFREIPVFALKGQIGHLIGACGAMEVLGVIDAIQRQRVLPSVNCEPSDPSIPLRLIRGEPLPMSINHVLKINAAFGGQNTALVFKKYGR